jgi:hypothetical protein
MEFFESGYDLGLISGIQLGEPFDSGKPDERGHVQSVGWGRDVESDRVWMTVDVRAHAQEG